MNALAISKSIIVDISVSTFFRPGEFSCCTSGGLGVGHASHTSQKTTPIHVAVSTTRNQSTNLPHTLQMNLKADPACKNGRSSTFSISGNFDQPPALWIFCQIEFVVGCLSRIKTRDHPMKTDAECERSIQAQKLIDLFEDVHGRPAISARELVDWAASPEGQAAIAVDHREEIFSRARRH
jgi:hypothetical protein